MTDKEKFRKEVEKLKSNLIYGACSSQIAMETRCKEEAYNEVLSILDTMQEEPVSDDLEEAIANEWKGYIDRGAATVDALEDNTQELTFAKGFYRGAQWKKEQFEKNRLKHCDSITNEQAELEQGFIDQHLDEHQRMPTFLDAIEYGMKKMKEQMMAKAVDGWIFRSIKDGKLRISDNKECWNGIRIPEKSIEKSYLFCTTDDAIKVKLVIVKEG